MSEERERVYHPAGGESRTKQSDALASDINSIMSKWIKDGVVPIAGRIPKYGDFSTSVDFHLALSRVKEAEAEFWHLPPAVRKVCENDPGKFLDLVMTPEGRRQLEGVGLTKEAAPETAPEPAVEPAEPESPPPSEPS